MKPMKMSILINPKLFLYSIILEYIFLYSIILKYSHQNFPKNILNKKTKGEPSLICSGYTIIELCSYLIGLVLKYNKLSKHGNIN